jgi:nitroreductase
MPMPSDTLPLTRADDPRDASLQALLRYAILAPSSHNSQPWRFVVDDHAIAVCADRVRALPVIDPYDRELLISCGAALLNLRVALHHVDFAHTIQSFPSDIDPDVLALVRIDAHGHHDPALAALLPAIPLRVTTRRPFSAHAVPEHVVQALIEAGAAEGAEVVCVSDTEERARIAGLVAQADREQFTDPRFRRELASWIDARRHGDGMPAYAAGAPALLDFATPLAASTIRTFDLGDGLAARHLALANGAPLLACIATSRDDRDAWLAAGQALERVLLVAAQAGFTASFLNQPIEVAALRERLGRMLGLSGAPQLLLRIGQGPRVPHAPRRPLADVVS